MMLNTAAIIQGVVAAVAVLAVAIVYFEKISSVSDSLETLTSSVESIEEDVAAVELKDMERTLTKLDFAIENQQNSTSFPSGEGTVYDKLDSTERDVGISYVTTHPNLESANPKSGIDMVKNNYDGKVTELKIEFKDEVNMQALNDELIRHDEIAEVEKEKFGFECFIRIQSPYDLHLFIPSEDEELVGDWVDEFLSCIDELLADIDTTTEKVESAIEQNLNGQ